MTGLLGRDKYDCRESWFDASNLFQPEKRRGRHRLAPMALFKVKTYSVEPRAEVVV